MPTAAGKSTSPTARRSKASRTGTRATSESSDGLLGFCRMWGGAAEQREFGSIYPMWYGEPAVRDRAAAVRKLRSLAERNYAPAQFALAMAFFDGDGVRRDYRQAYQYALA